MNKLVEALEKITNMQTPVIGMQLADQYVKIKSIARQALKEHAANKEGWVRVENRLPEVGEIVLVWVGDSANTSVKHFYTSSGKWKSLEKTILPEYYIITHWQPLPTPPTDSNEPTKSTCEHGIPYRYDCEHCREGTEPHECPHGIDTQMGCPQCDAAKMPHPATKYYSEEQVIDFVMTLTGTPSHISREAATGMVQHHFNPRPESVVADPIPPEDWDTCELFDYLVEHDLLPEDELNFV